MKKPTVILATALSAVALAGVVGVGVAAADPSPTPTPTATATPSTGTPTPAARSGHSAKPGRTAQHGSHGTRAHDLAGRALHGEVTLGGKKHRVVDVQRGSVSAVSATSITLRSADGFSATYVVDAGTAVRKAKEKSTIDQVRTGDTVRVVAVKDGATLTAKRVADRTQ